MSEEIVGYYDNFARKLLSEYVYGNSRLQAAINYALRWIPQNATNIIDIGCGLGWSTSEFKRHYQHCAVLGVDLSPRLAELAEKLFGAAGISYTVCDITSDDVYFQDAKYDAVIMLDVYEHIPKAQRGILHQKLSKALRRDGTVILTFPSVMHQHNLRSHHVACIQPVDEDVTFEDIGNLARDLCAQVIHYGHVSLGHSNDYVHSVLQRQPRFLKVNLTGARSIACETADERKERVVQRLGIKIMQNGLIIHDRGGPKICIAVPQQPGYSETFIVAHAERLPANVTMLHGGWVPLYRDGLPLLHREPLHRLWRGVVRRIFRLPGDHFEKEAVRRFLQSHEVRLVVAEYGPMGTGVMEACKKAHVPLVVHFHGADAYALRFIENFGQRYLALFSYAAALIVVSRDMQKQLHRLGAPEDKVFYNPNGVDSSLFQGARPFESPPVFVATGRFVDKKAPHLSLLAFQRVAAVLKEAKLVMIGDGPLWESCKQMSRALGLEERVSFPGPMSHVGVANTMQQARAFVQHSIRTDDGDSEGMPVAVLEAGASGLPVVATRHGGIQDVVLEGETGFLVAERDVAGMAEKMTELARDPGLADRMGRLARKRICEEFSMEKSIEGLWRIVENAMR